MKTQYPIIQRSPTIQDIENWCNTVTRLREEEDLSDFLNLQNVFMAGRKVGKIPTSNSDTSVDDREGDFSFSSDGTSLYVVVNASGTIKWGKISIDTAW